MTQLLPASNSPKRGQGAAAFSPSADLLTQLCPFYLAFDREMLIRQIGDAMQKLYPKLDLDAPLEHHFIIKYPNLAAEFDALCHQSDTLILLESRYNSLQFQGQVIADKSGLLLFLGSPQLADTNFLRSLAAKIFQPGRSLTAEPVLQCRATNLALRRLADELTAQQIDWQRALSEAELIASIFEQATDAIAITNTQGKILKVNTAFETATGYSRRDS
ncbi:MAG: PAS domain S-box protein [Leptolyngbyaceae cyanobacterium CRU_2_3]|nr:PAS domain S-box protein [Leptolyngbyaceae cyanobacterium CRU_2_3]